jgi:nucleotide-binding universal stress UspA family protein
MTSTSQRWRIVVGIDGSDEAIHALSWARDEAVLRDADLHVLHAWMLPVPTSELAAMVPTDTDVFEQAAEDVVTDALARIGHVAADGPRITTTAERGHAPTVLLEHGADADLLVVGSRGRGGFTGLLLGSISQQCLHHTQRPRAVIRAGVPLPGADDVVVGVDGSEGSMAALRWAIDEAAVRGARLAVLYATMTTEPVLPEGFGYIPEDERGADDAGRRLVDQMVDGALARTTHRPTEIERVAVHERAAPALLTRAEGAGLLVVGSRGRGGFAGLLLGSVSQHCVHHAPCAVVVVPHAG